MNFPIWLPFNDYEQLYLFFNFTKMDERIGSILIVVNDRKHIAELNQAISNYSGCIIGRQGISMKERDKSIISLVMEGTTDQIGGLAGQLGNIKGIQVKSMVIKSEK
jgi:putative iron-only hydrogenase system regulator